MYPASVLFVFFLVANITTGICRGPLPASYTSSLVYPPVCSVSPFQVEKNAVQPGSVDQEELGKISRKIVDNLVNQRFENVRDDFSEDLRSALTAEKIQEVWESVILQIGEFEEISSTQNRTTSGYRQVNHKCKFERNNANIEVTFSSDQKVIGLYIKP